MAHRLVEDADGPFTLSGDSEEKRSGKNYAYHSSENVAFRLFDPIIMQSGNISGPARRVS